VICDLGLPRDVDPAVAELPGITVIDLVTLNERLGDRTEGDAVRAAREIVTDEVPTTCPHSAPPRVTRRSPRWPARRRGGGRRAAADVRAAARLRGPEVREELAHTSAAWVDKLLAGTPTVRVALEAPVAKPTPRRCANCSGWTRRHPPVAAARATGAEPTGRRDGGFESPPGSTGSRWTRSHRTVSDEDGVR